jgi:hypothetical protein
VIGLAGQVPSPFFLREITINHPARPRLPRLDADIPQNNGVVPTPRSQCLNQKYLEHRKERSIADGEQQAVVDAQDFEFGVIGQQLAEHQSRNRKHEAQFDANADKQQERRARRDGPQRVSRNLLVQTLPYGEATSVKTAGTGLSLFLATAHYNGWGLFVRYGEAVRRSLPADALQRYRGKALVIVDTTDYAQRSRLGKKGKQMQYTTKVRASKRKQPPQEKLVLMHNELDNRRKL